ncbi:hypothetical protein JCM19231_4132 [Vibrio ishigakensis]|uniref:Outer membrane protein beta-barrel domain-containing protein n=1 Tax=Vibrio ishigakensis TaxID=1481914 RepID=A0A0B8NZX2_9VIBR|nr:hypothetical protein JCM19231_4132 [Vibrio ishigakensis]
MSLGGTQIDIQRVDAEYKFSAGVYTGLEYKFTDNFALQGQLRYLAHWSIVILSLIAKETAAAPVANSSLRAIGCLSFKLTSA